MSSVPAVAWGQQFGVWDDVVLEPGPGQGFDREVMVIDGETLVVGGVGAAYVFVSPSGAWQLQATLQVDGIDSVAIHEDTVVIGDTSAREAHVFVRDGVDWSLEQTLAPANPNYWGDAYGYGSGVAIHGDTSAVTSFGDQGAARVYVRSGGVWTEQALLKTDDREGYDEYGSAIALEADTLVVGASSEIVPQGGGVNRSSGAAYVYVRDGDPPAWSEQSVLSVVGIGSYAYFGESLSISGDTVLVGSKGAPTSLEYYYPDDPANGWPCYGAAYVFTRSGDAWTEEAALVPDGPYDPTRSPFGSVARFARRVALHGDVALITGYWTAPSIVFKREGTTWSQKKLYPVEDSPYSGFGESASITEARFVIGQLGKAHLHRFGEGTFVTPPFSCSNSIAEPSDFGPTLSLMLMVVAALRRTGIRDRRRFIARGR